MASRSWTRQRRGAADGACGLRGVAASVAAGVAAGVAAMPAARQLGQRPLPPGRPPIRAVGREGPGERVRAGRRLDPRADGVEVDADGSQRLFVEATQGTSDVEESQLNSFGSDVLVAKDRA